MKHAFSLAIKEWEWVKDNPVKKVSMEREPSPRDRWLTYEEEDMLISVSPSWLKELITFSVETGCRRGEMLSLQWKDVDLFKKVVNIFGSKTGEKRTIPLTPKAFEVLRDRQRVREKVRLIRDDLVFTHPIGRKINIHTLRSAFEDALKKAKIEDFRWHDLRHSFASRLAQNGVDPYAIQRLMGHKTFTTTQRYAHHCVESIRRGIEIFEASRAESQEKVTQIYHNFITVT
jgi:integrase